MRQESYKILSEHFAEKTGLQVIFQENACPSTDGKTIILPTLINEEYADALLGALLHETSHVKHTIPPEQVFRRLGDFARHCVNALEDIRIDALTCKQYPNALDFIRELSQDAITRLGDKLRADPVPVQVIKGLVLQHSGFNAKEIYPSAETQALLDKCEHYIAEAEACKNTWQIVNIARRLLIDLIGKEDKKQKLMEAASKAQAAQEKLEQINSDYREKYSQLKEQSEELRDQYKNIRRQQSQQHKYEREADIAEGNGKADEAAKAKAKASGKQKVIDLMNEKYKKDSEAYNKTDKEHEDLKREFYDTESERDEADQDIADEAEALRGIEPGRGLSINGFNAINKEAIKPQQSLFELPTKTIDEIIAEALIKRKEEAEIDEQGSRINEPYLAYYETEAEKLFAIREPKPILTKIAFVLDVSGSMGGFDPENRLGLAFNALDVLLRSVKNCLEQGAPCDVSVYAFGDNCKRVFEGLTNYKSQEAMQQINALRDSCGGGTDLLNAVNTVSADLINEAENRTLILISDAAVGQKDCQEIINNTSGDCKQVFIAIDGYMRDASLELFGDNNITNKENALEILGKALYKAI